MPQNGLHGLVGLGMARLATRAGLARTTEAAVGITLGAMLPDIDMYPTAVAFLMGRKDLVLEIHRSLTHSLVFVLALIVGGMIAKGSAWRSGLWGLAIGVSTHIALDLFLWFEQLDLFWPLSHMPGEHPMLPLPNVWASVEVPNLARGLREASEFAGFALLLLALDRIAPARPNTRKVQCIAWVCFAATIVSAFLLQEKPAIQNVLVFAPYLLFFLPYCWIQVWSRRSEIGAWCSGSRPAEVAS